MVSSEAEIVPSIDEATTPVEPTAPLVEGSPELPPSPRALPKINPTVKAFIAPMVMLGLTRMGISYDDPINILIGRVLYGVTHVSLVVIIAYVFWRIRRGDTKEGVVEMVKAVQKTGRKRSDRRVETDVEKKSFRDYDMSELRTLATTFSVGVAATLGLHLYMKLMPALILQIIMQPIAFYENPLVAIYVFGYDDVTRPFKTQKPSLFGPPADAAADPPAAVEATTASNNTAPLVSLPATSSDAVSLSDTAGKDGVRRRKGAADSEISQETD
eukprot:TRINITY_DN33146_c0_g1_i1.p1 TRINITY_DN33146_c0_g1~~TRINITY_DN33146_c0_g1_i1.p1  ORF type:complete len:272 (-),score=52.91 TRINITY_DN33146_c0_g1_i1:779-1594(-)